MTTEAQARRLIDRYLDPSVRWTKAEDVALRAALRERPEAAATYNRAVARHRVMTGGAPSMPSGFELARMASAAAELTPAAAPRRASFWIVPAAAATVALVTVLALTRAPAPEPATPNDAYIGARGLSPTDYQPAAGLGIGAVTEDGREYEAIFTKAVHLDDWLRLSFTNERPELGHLFVVAIQPERPAADRVVWIAPTPDEAQSLPVAIARYRTLPFEVRLGARHVLGPVTYLALFTEQPVSVDAMRAALDPSTTSPLPSSLESLMRERLRLSPRDVVQVLETTVVTGSASSTLPETPRKEAP